MARPELEDIESEINKFVNANSSANYQNLRNAFFFKIDPKSTKDDDISVAQVGNRKFYQFEILHSQFLIFLILNVIGNDRVSVAKKLEASKEKIIDLYEGKGSHIAPDAATGFLTGLEQEYKTALEKILGRSPG